MEVFDNITNIVRDDLEDSITPGCRLSIMASCFSIYAFQELKAQLNAIDELRFVFTSPTFVTEKAPKQKREFYIPRLGRERSLYGTEFEVKLRNELTQKAIAKECADWIRKKVTFKSNVSGQNMGNFITIENGREELTYLPINGFTTVDIGCERGNNSFNLVTRMEAPATKAYIQTFNNVWQDKEKLQDVTSVVIDNITTAYKENSPEFIYFLTLYNIFNEFLEDVTEDVLPNEATGFKNSAIWGMLYDFQKDAALAIINKLEKYNGCILADSVGLGKTFTALSVIKYYENRNKSVLVLCPKKLADNWNTYKSNYVNNPIAGDRLRYDVLFHTDLSRDGGQSNGMDLSRLNWENYDLVVIDESHNFRNGGATSTDDEGNEKENRYIRLLNRVIRAGIKTKVLMLSATPVNNRFNDLKNQLALAYEGNPDIINDQLDTTISVDSIFKQAQKAFNNWSELPVEQRTTNNLLKSLDYDFFELLDSVTIARSRKHIQKYYNTEAIGQFPTRLKPISKRPGLTDLTGAISYNEIFEQLLLLNLKIYRPSEFIQASRLDKYLDSDLEKGLTISGREQGIQSLMRINLLKRLESSVYAFSLTLERIALLISETLAAIEKFKHSGRASVDLTEVDEMEDLDTDDLNNDDFAVGRKIKIDLADMDYIRWEEYLKKDEETLRLLIDMAADITPEHDTKLQTLLNQLKTKQEQPINPGNKKVLIFTAFSDTAEYLYAQVSAYMKAEFGLNTAMVTGNVDGKTTLPRFQASLNNVLTCFSPVSKDRALLMPKKAPDIDILIATDCISEGQNLQDCDYCINYDIHWNPVRIIQRFGRIDRIGSHNQVIQLVNFWPDLSLDEYINLKARVENRIRMTVMTATGDDDLLNVEETGDLDYRKQQLKRLQEEVVDIEDMGSGISILDLGLNEFRLDLLDYIKTHGDLDSTPFGMSAVVPASEDAPAGVIYILKNLNGGVNIDNQNRLHPFYMVYISEKGQIICDHLSPKEMLDKMRLICKGKTHPNDSLCQIFNKETRNGRKMTAYSDLLSQAITSIIDVKEESEIDSFLGGKTISFLDNVITGLDDFELICFLVIKEEEGHA